MLRPLLFTALVILLVTLNICRVDGTVDYVLKSEAILSRHPRRIVKPLRNDTNQAKQFNQVNCYLTTNIIESDLPTIAKSKLQLRLPEYTINYCNNLIYFVNLIDSNGELKIVNDHFHAHNFHLIRLVQSTHNNLLISTKFDVSYYDKLVKNKDNARSKFVNDIHNLILNYKLDGFVFDLNNINNQTLIDLMTPLIKDIKTLFDKSMSIFATTSKLTNQDIMQFSQFVDLIDQSYFEKIVADVSDLERKRKLTIIIKLINCKNYHTNKENIIDYGTKLNLTKVSLILINDGDFNYEKCDLLMLPILNQIKLYNETIVFKPEPDEAGRHSAWSLKHYLIAILLARRFVASLLE